MSREDLIAEIEREEGELREIGRDRTKLSKWFEKNRRVKKLKDILESTPGSEEE